MPPKQKPKKGGLEDKQIQITVDIVKQYWPDYPISVANIRNPTRDFILKFYTECVDNLDQKCAYVTRSNLISYPPGLGEEELLFLKLSQIPSLVNADFKLGDLFIFDPKRVNNHIIVTMHFLLFTETLMDKMVQTCNRVFDTKEKMCSDQMKLNEVKEAKYQRQIMLTRAKEKSNILRETATIVSPLYEETLEHVEESEKKCKDSILQIEKLKSELEIQQDEIQTLEKVEVQLKTQIVTEEEYNHLKSNLESLIREEQNLEEIDASNSLFEQKQHIEQLQVCLQELNYLHLPEDLLKLSDLRVHLKNEQQNLEYELTIQQSSEADIKQLGRQLEKEKQLANSENKKIHGVLKKLMESTMLEEGELKKKYQQAFNNNLEVIMELEKRLQKYEADHKRLKNDLLQKYKTICKTQDMIVERIQNFVAEVKDKK